MSMTIFRKENGKTTIEFSDKEGERGFHGFIAKTMIENAIFRVALFHEVSTEIALSMFESAEDKKDFYDYAQELNVMGDEDVVWG